ncbi:hypothetical protein [Companilactobacillus futsaii]|uniref:Uncharacterized protein n=2 Tax=Companilactobacillus futsaii TaxID=938155 RepID=A0A5B7T1D8_9LACO|nr:hypothetical protein [Companilactobacillus futsaii]KRK90907.1 hypothetical protein FC88_GL001599 [Companilactobacillus futsaii JCM 17355]QCX24364.1 hypothetical protein FG051_04295 [Companilactobacillus futsaii]
MKQVKTFITYVEENNDEQTNEFMKSHKVLSVKSQVMQGFTYNSETNYVTNIYKTFKPAIITTIVYEVEK